MLYYYCIDVCYIILYRIIDLAVEVRVTPIRTEIIIRATRTREAPNRPTCAHA